jgi:ABC-2 type transport system ATP-binding protein
MLKVEGLQKSFDSKIVVDDVSFSISAGQVMGFLGPNGAGKTTTMRMITGFLTPDKGKIEICGINALENLIEAQKHIGYLPEGVPLYGDMNVIEFLEFIGTAKGMPSKDIDYSIDNAIQCLSLEKVYLQPIETLSKGFKRRVGIAQAILSNPSVLILDEPTDGLDPNQKHDVRQLIRTISKDKAIIISTHILEEVEAICTDVVLINQGKIIVTETPNDFIKRSESFNAVSVIIETSSLQKAKEILEDYQTIHKVETLSSMQNWSKILIYPQNKNYILSDVTEAIHKNSWKTGAVSVENGRIDDVFRKITLGHHN